MGTTVDVGIAVGDGVKVGTVDRIIIMVYRYVKMVKPYKVNTM